MLSVNIYSLLKQNIKSCNAKRRRQRHGKKKINRSFIVVEQLAEKQLHHRAAHFFVHFAWRSLKRPETS